MKEIQSLYEKFDRLYDRSRTGVGTHANLLYVYDVFERLHDRIRLQKEICNKNLAIAALERMDRHLDDPENSKEKISWIAQDLHEAIAGWAPRL